MVVCLAGGTIRKTGSEMVAIPYGINQRKQTFQTIAAGFVIGFLASYLYLDTYLECLQTASFCLAAGSLKMVRTWQLDSNGQDDRGEEFYRGKDGVARYLEQRVRVLCWVMTNPKNHQTRDQHIKATWGKRCDILLFMSTTNDTSLPSVSLDVKESYSHLWGKTKAAFIYIYTHYRGQYDWVLKVDDDTYVVVENLRYFLYSYNSSDPLYFGCRFKPFVKQGFMSGGAGYVLSEEAVKRFVTIAIPDEKICRKPDTGREDVEIGKCLEKVGVIAMDSRDEHLRGRFFPLGPRSHMFPNPDPNFWYWSHRYYNTTEGLNCCSDTAISFHYIGPQEMYVMEYLIYYLWPHGINIADTLDKLPRQNTTK